MSDTAFYDLLRRCREYCREHGPIDAGEEPRTTTLVDENCEILQYLVSMWRRNGSPPTSKELGPAMMSRVKRRYGTLTRARRLAKGMLTEAEKWRLDWRCRHCGKGGFTCAKGRATHERVCEVRKDKERISQDGQDRSTEVPM